jgi:hypothetical protein
MKNIESLGLPAFLRAIDDPIAATRRPIFPLTGFCHSP